MTLESAQLESHGDNRMKFETFKAGAWIARYQYKSFEPVLVDHAWIWDCWNPPTVRWESCTRFR